MTRDRMTAFKDAMNNSSSMEDDSQQVIISLKERDDYMETFFKMVNELLEEINELEVRIPEIERVFSTLVINPGGEMGSIEKLTRDINEKSKSIKSKLKNMRTHIDDISEEKAEKRIKSTQYSMLSKKFLAAMTNYNLITVDYNTKYKENLTRIIGIAKKDFSSQDLEEILESEKFDIFTDNFIASTAIEKERLANIKARRDDILKLERNIKELHGLFIDMAVLVDEQGDLIDNIAKNVSSTTNYTENGLKQIEQAKQYQSAARRKKIYIIIILIIILAIIALITYLFVKE